MRRRLWKITLPVAAGSVLLNAAGLVDAAFLQGRLAALLERDPQGLLAACPGMIPEAYLQQPQALPTFLYGCYTMALTLYLLVPAITQAFGVSALPAVTQAWARGNKGELAARMASVLRVTALFCFPAGVGLSALAGPVTRLPVRGEPVLAHHRQGFGAAGAGLPGRGHEHPPLQHAPGGGPGRPAGEAAARRPGHQAGGELVAVRHPPGEHPGGRGGDPLLLSVFDGGPAVVPAAGRRGGAVPVQSCSPSPWPAPWCAAAPPAWPMGSCGRFCQDFPGPKASARGASVAAGALVYLAGLLILRSIAKNDLFMLPQGQKIAKMLEKQGWI